MSLSTYYLEYGRHAGELRCCRCRRAYAPTSNTASHDNHEKINSWVSFSFLYEYGAPLGGPSGCRSSAMIRCTSVKVILSCPFSNSLIIHQVKTKNHNHEEGLDTRSQLAQILMAILTHLLLSFCLDIEKIYQTLKTVFHWLSQHLKFCQNTLLQSLLGVWISG